MKKAKETLDEAIFTHSRWKTRLKKMIESGQSEVALGTIGDPHHCQFGKWLDSSKGAQKSKYHSEVNRLHSEFHKNAAEVASLAITGQAKEATHRMELGSTFSKTSAQLVNILADWKDKL